MADFWLILNGFPPLQRTTPPPAAAASSGKPAAKPQQQQKAAKKPQVEEKSAEPSSPSSASVDVKKVIADFKAKSGSKADIPVYAHKAVPTAEEQADELKSADIPDSAVIVKNLFVKDKGGALFLLCVPHDAKVNLKELRKTLGAKGDIRFADAEALLQVPKGSVTPLAIVNNKEVQVVLANSIDAAEFVIVHPLTNTASILIPTGDLKKFVEASGNSLKVVDVGEESSAPKAAASGKPAAKPKKEEKKKKAEAFGDDEFKDEVKKGDKELIGIEASKTKDFSRWYSQVVFRSEMIDYYDVSGCYILRPWSYFVWEQIQAFFDRDIKNLGVKNTYFPLFVSKSALTREKDHIEGFAPEVAWVTKAGKSDLQEHIAIRPTSETIMYSAFAKWIRSHRDLPLQINQWSNVVRWEFKNPLPFIRSREFLWQEGHSAFATEEEAVVEVHQILDLYAKVYEELLAVPVTKGKKTEKEKFAGAKFTTTIEVFVPAAGRGVQAATSHCLGQNFAHMFDIQFEDSKGKAQHVWQNSWGLSTRSLGVMVMVHGDDKGLVLPPRVAPVQVIFVPISFKDSKHLDEPINKQIEELVGSLKNAGIRADSDLRSIYNPGWKFNHWELKGVPIRLEVGPKDFEKKQVTLVRRVDGVKKAVPVADVVRVCALELEDIQKTMYEKAKAAAAPLIFECETWEQFLDALAKGGRGVCPSCDTVECEMDVRERSGEEGTATAAGLSGSAKSLCIPYSQPKKSVNGLKCFQCGNPAKVWTLFGRSY